MKILINQLMKKLFLLLLLSLGSGVYANDVREVQPTKQNDDAYAQVCCRRGKTTKDGQNVTVRACVESTGDVDIDKGHACEKAVKAVDVAIKTLEITPDSGD
jgi:hypothetical protein